MTKPPKFRMTVGMPGQLIAQVSKTIEEFSKRFKQGEKVIVTIEKEDDKELRTARADSSRVR